MDASGRQVPALIAVFKPACTAVALQRGTTVFGLTVIRNSDER
jgi:hypothetical protein